MKDPAFLFYAQDFITGTMFMNNEQVGIYVRLLCAQHQHGGLIDKTSFNSLVGNNDIVRSKFIETGDGFFNERMMKEIVRRSVKSSNLSANAHIRWDKYKQKHSKSNAKASHRDMPTETETETEDVTKDIYKEFVKLTKDQHQKLIDTYGDKITNEFVQRLNDYIGSTGKRYKSHYHTILTWLRKDPPKAKPQPDYKAPKEGRHTFTPPPGEAGKLIKELSDKKVIK